MKKNKIIAIVITVLTTIILLLQCYDNYLETGKVDREKVSEIVEIIVNEINQSTTEIPILTETEEQALEYQETTEKEGFEEQGEIAYNGSDKTPNVQVGEYAGLTYYSQVDNRWKDKLYSSTGNQSQTIGSSGCGPTSAAMVVSSIKGTITPDIMADLFQKNGYRSANNGTYLSAFRYTADVFDIEYKELYKLNEAVDLLKNNYYVIASCGNGLFTYGGHIIVLVGVEGDYIKVYDPYLYDGKFDVSTRRGKAEVKGNTVYVSIENFREYAGYTRFFAYKNDRVEIKENTTTTTVVNNADNFISKDYKVKITAKIGLNIRNGASANYKRIGGYSKNTVVTILAEKDGWGKTEKGWICLQYTEKINNNITNTVGQVKRFKGYTTLYSNSNLSGTKYQYLSNTSIIVLENISSNVDKIKVRQTGRIAYVSTNAYK